MVAFSVYFKERERIGVSFSPRLSHHPFDNCITRWHKKAALHEKISDAV